MKMGRQQQMDWDQDDHNGKVDLSTADKDGPCKFAVADDNERKLQSSGPDHGGGGGSAAAAAGDIVDNDKKSPKSKIREERPSLSLAAVSVAAAVCRLKVSTTRDFNA